MSGLGGITNSPLNWPTGWKRTSELSHSRFGKWNARPAIYKASTEVLAELERMGVPREDVVITANVAFRLDGLPRSSQRMPEDPGVSVWFTMPSGEDRVLACDRWDKVGCNLWAIAKTIEALRGIERWGACDLERAFTGAKALPSGSGVETGIVRVKSCWEVLGVKPGSSAEVIRRAYRDLAKELAPRTNADDETKIRELNIAKEDALERLPIR